ncbi:cytochrome c-type biogenesis protein [Candidatus Vesicomyidisocius calyptogenae]|uniref:Cytochrome c-type biogenesis protein n=1 Tax=Vesicomyosocius okutanii subsp. Calyptogena okutanii (strain HA) TaxID=412965 RepID=A5CWL5_VESOH|nr:cytochrome c-type biogenesis protein [Candidatus Vesicomyosocius okutanii]BAF61667.1 cytochrome c-type biogenesis protein CcmH [Candidatus Vesicomyosocius okutanii]
MLFYSILFLLGFVSYTHVDSFEAKSYVNNQQQRYQTLINEIRCPVCQGQSIGGSNAGLAKDLREKVMELILEENTDNDIRQFMTDRYGDFVVFKPPVNKNTYLLWFAPFIFLVLGLFFLVRSLLTKESSVKSNIDTTKAKDLLK